MPLPACLCLLPARNEPIRYGATLTEAAQADGSDSVSMTQKGGGHALPNVLRVAAARVLHAQRRRGSQLT